jgi:uncharacterized DUF497 family protein
MTFEFDPAKSAANQSKHGIDFVTAQKLWEDSNLLVLSSKHPGEPRQLAIGQWSGKLWTAIFTERSGAVRIISVRRARNDEIRIHGRH